MQKKEKKKGKKSIEKSILCTFLINPTWESDSAGTGRIKESNQACLLMAAVIFGKPI